MGREEKNWQRVREEKNRKWMGQCDWEEEQRQAQFSIARWEIKSDVLLPIMYPISNASELIS